jgi:hypothetical protein
MSIPIYFYPNYRFGDLENNLCDALLSVGKDFYFERGIDIVEDVTVAKIILCYKVDTEILQLAINNINVRLIILERYDSASLATNQTIVEMPEILAVFKEYVYRTSPCIALSKRPHYADIDPTNTQVVEYNLSTNVQQKIRAVPWNLKQYSHLPCLKEDMRIASQAFGKPKKIDIFAVFHDHEKCPILSKHRRLARSMIESIRVLKPNLCIVTEAIKIKRNYVETLASARVVFAPYGLGERIACDQFAVLSGARVVKPDCSNVRTVPDLYQSQHITFTKPDLSDLIDVLLRVLMQVDQEDVKKQIVATRQMLLDFHVGDYANLFCDVINDAFRQDV